MSAGMPELKFKRRVSGCSSTRESRLQIRGNLEGSVRSLAHRRRGRDREHDLIEAGLNEAAGCFGAMGRVATACWRDRSDDGSATDAKRCWRGRSRGAGAEREKQVKFSRWPVLVSVLRRSIGIASRVATRCAASSVTVKTNAGSDEIMTCHSRTADRWMNAARLRSAAWCRRIRGR
jgi:hypothetical protein